jgi:predicted nucleic acid-binding Zn ribbon protein
VGKQTEAVRMKNGILYVATTSSTWAQELSFLKKEIIKKFNQRAGEEAIRDIRFSVKGEKIGGGV